MRESRFRLPTAPTVKQRWSGPLGARLSRILTASPDRVTLRHGHGRFHRGDDQSSHLCGILKFRGSGALYGVGSVWYQPIRSLVALGNLVGTLVEDMVQKRISAK